MITIKPVLQPYQNNEGLHNLLIRIYRDKVRRYARTSIFIKKSQFNAKKGRVKSHPYENQFNIFIEDRINQGRRFIVEYERKGKYLNLDVLKNFIEGNHTEHESDFVRYIQEFVKNHYSEQENDSMIVSYRYLIQNLLEFSKNKPINIYEINNGYVLRFQKFLRHKFKASTVNLRLALLKYVINHAINDSSLDYSENPFASLKNLKIKEREFERIALTDEEINSIENFSGTRVQNMSRDAFLIMYYAGGVRASDILKLTVKEYISSIYSAKKTSKASTIIHHPKLDQVIGRYLGGKQDNDFILPYMNNVEGNFSEVLKNQTKKINAGLKTVKRRCKIPIKLTTKTARITYANRVRDQLGETYASMVLNHSDFSTTKAYLENRNAQEVAIKKIFGGE